MRGPPFFDHFYVDRLMLLDHFYFDRAIVLSTARPCFRSPLLERPPMLDRSLLFDQSPRVTTANYLTTV